MDIGPINGFLNSYLFTHYLGLIVTGMEAKGDESEDWGSVCNYDWSFLRKRIINISVREEA